VSREGQNDRTAGFHALSSTTRITLSNSTSPARGSARTARRSARSSDTASTVATRSMPACALHTDRLAGGGLPIALRSGSWPMSFFSSKTEAPKAASSSYFSGSVNSALRLRLIQSVTNYPSSNP